MALKHVKGNSKKTIILFINRKHCKCALVNKKKLKSFNSESIGLPNVKLHFNEDLTEYNNTLAFYGRKLKRAGLLNSTYTLNGTVHILRTVGERPIKVFHMSKLYELYPNCEFHNKMVMFQLMLLVMSSVKLLKFYNFFFLMKDLAFIGYCVIVTAVCICLNLCVLNVYMQRYPH